MTLKVTYVTGAELARLDAELRATERAYYEANPDVPMPCVLKPPAGWKADWARHRFIPDPSIPAGSGKSQTPEGD